MNDKLDLKKILLTFLLLNKTPLKKGFQWSLLIEWE